MASSTTLRYALNLISCRQVIARKRKADKADVEDCRMTYRYFMEKRSVQWLRVRQGSLVFEEISESVNGDAAMGEARET